MEAEAGAVESIAGMGYATADFGSRRKSYYRLDDGTIISAMFVVHSAAPDPAASGIGRVDSSCIVGAYAPERARRPERFRPHGAGEIGESVVDEDVRFDAIAENFHDHSLSNGSTLRIKTVVDRVKKTSLFTENGEPVYVVSVTPVVDAREA